MYVINLFTPHGMIHPCLKKKKQLTKSDQLWLWDPQWAPEAQCAYLEDNSCCGGCKVLGEQLCLHSTEHLPLHVHSEELHEIALCESRRQAHPSFVL